MRKVVRAAAAIAAVLLACTAVSAQSETTEAEAQYCSRALDVGGIFCAIGCPNECECHFGLYVSECCCGLAS